MKAAASPIDINPAAGVSVLVPKVSRATLSQGVVRARIPQRVTRARVLHDYLAHHCLRIGAVPAHFVGGHNKAEITDATLNTAQPAVTAAVEINFAGIRRRVVYFQDGP